MLHGSVLWEFSDSFQMLEPFIYCSLTGRPTPGSLWTMGLVTLSSFFPSKIFAPFQPSGFRTVGSARSLLVPETWRHDVDIGAVKLINAPFRSIWHKQEFDFCQLSGPVWCLPQFPVLRVFHPKVLRSTCLLNLAFFQHWKIGWAAPCTSHVLGSRKGKSKSGNTPLQSKPVYLRKVCRASPGFLLTS